jgi:hypothetical protein
MSVRAYEATPAPAEPQENPQAEPSASQAPLPQSICEVLAAAAAVNGLPAEFFTRLIWQESRFKPEAVSHADKNQVSPMTPGPSRIANFVTRSCRASSRAPFMISSSRWRSFSLLADLKAVCAAFPDPRKGRGGNIAMVDFGLSAFAMFFMQSASFLSFQWALENGQGRSNCQSLFGTASME